jgi:polyferredoxin/tetratricopeptide (TPR) repeat protein
LLRAGRLRGFAQLPTRNPFTKALQKSQTTVPLPVIAINPDQRRHRPLGRWRALSLLAVHLIVLAHVAHWLTRGTTLTPVEPSESMETVKTGAINAGAVFFSLSIIATLFFGRFFCGWGCHFIAYQDLCGWMLRRVGITPKPLRSRLLLFMPLVLALYMFCWPLVYRWYQAWAGAGVSWMPQLSTHWTTTTFWQTFPGWGFGLATIFVAGFSVVYFLGAKGFCTYACPYGAFYGLADRAAPLRVRVRQESCDHNGTCTTVCTSNVEVAAEVARYGMVVSSGCMKCGDCIRSCPNDALSFGWGKPALFAARSAKKVKPPAGARLPWTEELILAFAFLVSLFAWRGLYGGFPLLMSAGMSAIFASIALMSWRLLVRRDVELQGRVLKEAGRLRRGGWVVACAGLVVFVATAQAAAVQLCARVGENYFASTGVADGVLAPGFDPARNLTPQQRAGREQAQKWLDRSARFSLIQTTDLTFRRSWVRLLGGDLAGAEELARSALAERPDWAYLHYHLGRIHKVQGQNEQALAAWRAALERDPSMRTAEVELVSMLATTQLFDELGQRVDAMLARNPSDALALYYRGVLIFEAGDAAGGIDSMRRAVAADPRRAEAQYQLGYMLAATGQPAAAIEPLETAIRLRPNMAAAHYNLAVAWLMLGERQKALPYAERAAILDPADAQTRAFLEMLTSPAD